MAQQVIDKEQSGPVTELPKGIPAIFEFQVFKWIGAVMHVSGNVFFYNHPYRITASEASYNVATGEAVMRDVVYTTCQGAKPDYRLEAREITLLSGDRVRAKGVSVYLGQFKIISLPSIKMRFGGNNVNRAIFPRLSFSSSNGFSAAQRVVIADSYRLNAIADLKLTTRRGVQGDISNVWAIDGNLGDFPGRFLTYNSLRESVLIIPEESYDPPADPIPHVTPAPSTERISRLREFSLLTINQQTYNVQNSGLRVTRQPEVGLRYIGNYLSLTGTKLNPRLEIYPEVIASWGRFKETPGTVSFTERSRIALTAGANILPLGPRTAVQPVFQYSFSEYDTGTSYRTSAYAIDASHISSDGSMASLRYIKRHESGFTPFLFDKIDVKEEIEGAFLVNMQRHTMGLAVGYNLDEGNVYDWSLIYGYHTDCLAGSITWDNLQKNISVDIRVLAR